MDVNNIDCDLLRCQDPGNREALMYMCTVDLACRHQVVRRRPPELPIPNTIRAVKSILNGTERKGNARCLPCIKWETVQKGRRGTKFEWMGCVSEPGYPCAICVATSRIPDCTVSFWNMAQEAPPTAPSFAADADNRQDNGSEQDRAEATPNTALSLPEADHGSPESVVASDGVRYSRRDMKEMTDFLTGSGSNVGGDPSAIINDTKLEAGRSLGNAQAAPEPSNTRGEALHDPDKFQTAATTADNAPSTPTEVPACESASAIPNSPYPGTSLATPTSFPTTLASATLNLTQPQFPRQLGLVIVRTWGNFHQTLGSARGLHPSVPSTPNVPSPEWVSRLHGEASSFGDVVRGATRFHPFPLHGALVELGLRWSLFHHQLLKGLKGSVWGQPKILETLLLDMQDINGVVNEISEWCGT